MRDNKGRFIKGHAGHWKGKTLPETAKIKLSEFFKVRKGANNPAWKGGKIKSGGYIRLWIPDHPNADSKGYVAEHRYIMEQILGRRLEANECVHHIDGDKYNNSPDNLELTNWRDHAIMHKAWRLRKNLHS